MQGGTSHDHDRVAPDAQAVGEGGAVDARRLRELEAILESALDGVFVVDQTGRFTVANWCGTVMHGLRPKDVLGHTIAEFPDSLRLRHRDGRPLQCDEHPLARALAGEEVRGFEKIAFNKETGRDVHFQINATPVRDAGGGIIGAVEVARDVTRVHELDELKDQFIRVAAHELKTPVAIVKGYVGELLRTGTDMPEPRRRMLDAIARGTARLTNIVQDLVDVSQLHLGSIQLTVERVDLAEIVEQAAAGAALLARRHEIKLPPVTPVAVRADARRLRKTLDVLIDNAIRYSPNGGEIAVEVRVTEDRAVVTVRDHGVGIPRDRQSQIFERFYRAHTDTPYDAGGMGVSLFIARSIMREMGGDIWFDSEEGRGSRFHVGVPLRGPR